MSEIVRKIMGVSVKAVDDVNGIITFLGTTPTKDRWNEIVDPQGVILDNYRKNPVFLWAHNYQVLPIGKSLAEKVTPYGIEFDIKFDLADQFAKEVYRKYKEGYLQATSIGFIPLEWEDIEDSTGRVRVYRKWELLELSAVPVPANPDALQMALRKAASLEEFSAILEEEGEKMLEDLAIEKGVVKFEATKKADENREWDGPAAEQRLRKWASKDGSGDKETIDWAKYARGFLFVDSEDKENFGAYYFPHHDVIDGELYVVWRGVATAMAYLLKDYDSKPVWADYKQEMYNHLVKHYEQFDKEPPELKSVQEILFELATGKLVALRKLKDIDDVVMAYASCEIVKAEKIAMQRQTKTVYSLSDTVEKVGAVLNRANKERLMKARDLIQEVLDSAEPSTEIEHSNETAIKEAAFLYALQTLKEELKKIF